MSELSPEDAFRHGTLTRSLQTATEALRAAYTDAYGLLGMQHPVSQAIVATQDAAAEAQRQVWRVRPAAQAKP